MKFFKKLDLFSYEGHFTFNDNGDTGFKTFTGGVLSFISLIFSFFFSIYFFLHFIRRNDFSIIYSSKIDKFVNISYSNSLPFLFRLTDNQSYPLNKDGLFNITFRIWYKNSTSLNYKYKYDEILMEKCDINKHFGNYISNFNDMEDIDSFYCPSIRLSNQSLLGIYGSNQFIYYNFEISKCNNKTNNNSCLTNEEIETTLKYTYLDIKYIDYKIDNLNNKNPQKLIIRNERILTSIHIFKKILLSFKKIIYMVDKGYFYEIFSKKIFHQYDNLHIDTLLIENEDTFLSLIILNSGETIKYKKTFLKFQHYLSYIGGITNSVTFIFYLINYFNSKNSYYKKLIKDFIIENQIKKKNINKNVITFEKNALSSTSNKLLNMKNALIQPKKASINTKIENPLNLNDKDKNSFNIFNRYKEKDDIDRKFTFTIFPLNLIKFSNRKELKWYIKEINKRLNIIYILNILQQVEFQINKKKSMSNNEILKSTISNSNKTKQKMTQINNYSNLLPKNNNNFIKESELN